MNFANAVKNNPNPNRTNSRLNGKQSIQQPDEDGKGPGETNLPVCSSN